MDTTLRFNLRDNSEALLRRYHNFRQSRIPVAMRDAANATGRYMYGALRSTMREKFDRPTPWTLGGLRFTQATTAKPIVQIWLEEFGAKGIPAAKFLQAQILGGQRRHKRFERSLIEAGLMPPTAYAVPGRQAPLDAYGNVPGPFIVRMLSDLRAFGEQGYRANRRGDKARTGARKHNYFFVPSKVQKSHLAPGVYWHMPGGLLGVVFIFVPRAHYRVLFDFYRIGGRAYDRVALRFLAEQIERQARGG